MIAPSESRNVTSIVSLPPSSILKFLESFFMFSLVGQTGIEPVVTSRQAWPGCPSFRAVSKVLWSYYGASASFLLYSSVTDGATCLAFILARYAAVLRRFIARSASFCFGVIFAR